MKRIAAVLVAFALAGCATNKEFYEMQTKLIEQVVAMKKQEMDLKLEQQKTRTEAMKAIGPKLDAGGAAAVGVVNGLGDRGGTAAQESSGEILKLIALQRPPETWDDKLLKWASVLIPATLQGVKIYADKDLGIAQVNGNTRMHEATMAMISQINRDTASGVAHAGQQRTPTYQITVENSQGVGILEGTGSYQGPLTLTCSSASGPGGQGGSPGAATPPTVPGAGGAGAASGTSPVNCTVTR